VIAPADAALTQMLRGDDRFELLYESKLPAVFLVREDPKNGAADLVALNKVVNGAAAGSNFCHRRPGTSH
jgi:hypothetical protein